MLLPESRLSQRSRRSLAVRSQIRLAQNQPSTGATTAARAYQPQKPSNGMRSRNSAARAPTPTSRAVANAPARLSSRLVIVVRIWKTSSHTSRPGRKSSPHRTMTAVSQLSRSRRMRCAASACSTTTWGWVPKDWMSGARPEPSMRSMTARENASPRLGRNSLIRGLATSDLCHSLLALSISSASLSR